MRYCAYCINVALTGRYVTWLPGAQLHCWMLLTVYTLPQLAVSAKILCLLMVVICGALPSMNATNGRSLLLYNPCSYDLVNVFPNGEVMAKSVSGGQPNLTTIMIGTDLDLLIYSPVQEMYLCFMGSKLQGRKISREKAEKMDKCLFREYSVVESGYTRYQLAKQKDRYIGFNRNGMQIRRVITHMRKKQLKCLNFAKYSKEFDISRHNQKVAKFGGASVAQPAWPKKRRPSVPNAIKGPCHSVRHRHGLRRRNCDLT